MAKRQRTAAPGSTPVFRGIRLLNQAQQDCWDTIDANRVTYVTGVAGTGKSQISLAYAVEKTHAGEFEKVIVTRPIVEAADEALGFLPGEVENKVAPYLAPALTVAKKAGASALAIEFLAIAYMRGHTFEDCIVVVEEAQNCSVKQLRLIQSRLGKNAKIIIAGDTKQTDVRDSGLAATIRALQGVPGVGFFEFQKSDVVRDPLINLILDRMETL